MTEAKPAAGQRMTEYELRQEMVRVGRLLWDRGYVAATDGNLSARLGSGRLLVTPSGVSKGFLSERELVVIEDSAGDLRPSAAGQARGSSSAGGRGGRPSSEILMHLEVYRQRPDVRAVVHAHPPMAVAFSIAGVSLARCVLPEVVVTLGGIPTTEYATPGTPEVSESIRQALRCYDALVLAHHGSLTVGRSLWEAYLLLEKVEQTAQITLAAQQLGRVHTLSPDAVQKLETKRAEMLQQEGRNLCEGCSACILGSAPKQALSVLDARSERR